jgi:hypothetical protein
MVPYVWGSLFAGEQFIDLPDAQHRAVRWCRATAGLRVHGTTAYDDWVCRAAAIDPTAIPPTNPMRRAMAT